jgi:hypothetical protein
VARAMCICSLALRLTDEETEFSGRSFLAIAPMVRMLPAPREFGRLFGRLPVPFVWSRNAVQSPEEARTSGGGVCVMEEGLSADQSPVLARVSGGGGVLAVEGRRCVQSPEWPRTNGGGVFVMDDGLRT